MTLSLPPVRIRLTFGYEVSEELFADRVMRRVGALLADLGLDAPVTVETAIDLRLDDQPSVLPVMVAVNNRPASYPVNTIGRAWVPGVDPTVIPSFAVADALIVRPSLLLPVDPADLPISGLDVDERRRLHAMLEVLLDMGVSVANVDVLLEAIRAQPDADPRDVAEDVVDRISIAQISIAVNSDYLRAVTESAVEDPTGLFPALRSAWLTQLGLPLPPIGVVRDDSLVGTEFLIRVNDLSAGPFIGIPVDRLIVPLPPEQLENVPEAAISASYRGDAASVVPWSARDQLIEAGIGFEEPFQYLVGALRQQLRWRSGSLVTVSVVANRLAWLAPVAPLIAERLQAVDMRRLTRVLRALINEKFSLRHLTGIGEALLAELGRPAAPATEEELVEAVRRWLPYQSIDLARNGFRVPVYLLRGPLDGGGGPSLADLADPDQVRQAGNALVSLWSGLADDVGVVPAVLADDDVRAQAAAFFRLIHPDVQVICRAEVPPSIEVQQLDIISVGALPEPGGS